MASVGVGIIGREVTFTFGAGTLLGTVSKGISFSNELGDTTDDAASGWKEYSATALLKFAEFTVSGTLKNMELVNAYFGASQIFEVVMTYPDGSTVTFNAAMTGAPSLTHEANALSTYEASFESSGSIGWVAGT